MAQPPAFVLPPPPRRKQRAVLNYQDLKGDDQISPVECEQTILLSPPPLLPARSPLDEAGRNNPDGRSSLDSNRPMRNNSDVYRANAQYAASLLYQNNENVPFKKDSLAGLQIQTDLSQKPSSLTSTSTDADSTLSHSMSAMAIPRRTPSIRALLHTSAGSLSPGSAYSSPQLAALLDMTPLPSPIGTGGSSWKLGIRSRASSTNSTTHLSASSATLSASTSNSIPTPTTTSPPQREAYPGLQPWPALDQENRPIDNIKRSEEQSGHARTRSLSEYVPNGIQLPKPRQVAASGTHVAQEIFDQGMKREEYLAAQRGLTPTSAKPPTPPSNIEAYDSADDIDEPTAKRQRTEVYKVTNLNQTAPRKYKSIRLLGQGTFSKVFLAVRQVDSGDDGVDYSKEGTTLAGVKIRSQRLVAVKVVESGPAGGANAERVEVSLRREVEIMKAVNHPSLVHLKGFSAEAGVRALLVINYCPGGDLFELASSKLSYLTPSLVRRIFSELVSAVRYLHLKYIVHRDIKLESMRTYEGCERDNTDSVCRCSSQHTY